jgi:Cu+-exporting ATPase
MENCSVLKDPVCGMTVTNKSFYYLEQGGHSHYFCGSKCRARFAAQGGAGPQARLKLAARRILPVQIGWVWPVGAALLLAALASMTRWLG